MTGHAAASERFNIDTTCPVTGARAAQLTTPHGVMHTPIFMPVGTQGTVKGLTPEDVRSTGAECLLGNTYHLWLQPGSSLIQRAGGLHRFMAWDQSILTDSGGFQVFSLAHLVGLSDDGATFQCGAAGGQRSLSPEVAMQIQGELGSDIAMVLDVCSRYGTPRDELLVAAERTTRWARRSFAAPHAPGQAVFGIVQGGTDLELRRRSAEELSEIAFDGFAVGGLSIGEERSETWPALEEALRWLPPRRPRYLMGVGAPDDVLEGIARGVDMFDCVLPTRLGRNGSVFTRTGRIDLRNAALADNTGPIDDDCDCAACTCYSVSYLHHLIRCREELGLRLASIHNIRFLTRLAAGARVAILAGTFPTYREAALAGWRRPNATAGKRDRALWLKRHRPDV